MSKLFGDPYIMTEDQKKQHQNRTIVDNIVPAVMKELDGLDASKDEVIEALLQHIDVYKDFLQTVAQTVLSIKKAKTDQSLAEAEKKNPSY